MAAPDGDDLDRADPPPVAVRRRRLPSAVWAVPIVAALIGAYLVWTTYNERGPSISVAFPSAAGLVAGKTPVKYKDVEIGKIVAVTLSEDRATVSATAEMGRAYQSFLTDGAKFWLVSAQISAGGVSGLDTLLSGAYVGMEPGPADGEAQRAFVAATEPPVIQSDVPGTEFVLTASRLGGVGRGSAIYFRGFQAGQILGSELSPDRQTTLFRAFVRAPYNQQVTASSRFWNASGISVDLAAGGVRVNIESLQAVLAGGVGFDEGDGKVPATPGSRFELFATPEDARDSAFTERIELMVVFDDSVRGLRPGADVEIQGLRIGTVKDLGLLFDPAQRSFTVPVKLEIEPQRFQTTGGTARTIEEGMDRLRSLVEAGLRAQLQMGSIISGELIVGFDFFPDAPAATLGEKDGLPVVPAVPTQLEAISASLTTLLNRIAALPLDGLVDDMRRTVQSVDALVASPELKASLSAVEGSTLSIKRLADELASAAPGLIGDVRQDLSQIDATLRTARSTLSAAQQLIGPDSGIRNDISVLMRELQTAARSIRVFADYLERHPEALIRGKGNPTR